MAPGGLQPRGLSFQCTCAQQSAFLQAASALALVSIAQRDLHVKLDQVFGPLAVGAMAVAAGLLEMSESCSCELGEMALGPGVAWGQLKF